MQPIEKALKNVFDSIGSDYTYPVGAFLSDDFGMGIQCRNPFHGQTPTPLRFGFGTQQELNVFLTQTKDKYPLVWLVYPLEETHNNNAQAFYTYPTARLVFAINSDSDKLVQTRVQTTRFVLDQIIEKFEKLMRSSKFKKYVYVDKIANIKQIFRANYSENKKDGKVIDVWDAISFDCIIHFLSDCLPKN